MFLVMLFGSSNREIEAEIHVLCLKFSFPALQGTKVLQMFMWYLNPRQVFDLSQEGPRDA